MILFYSVFLLMVVTHGHFEGGPKVLLISFDGFRYDYLDLTKKAGYNLPNFDYLISNGVKAKKLIPPFITRTFPSHASIITGCYEESHGIIDNTFYDPTSNKTFSISRYGKLHEHHWFDNVEPIWVTNMKNGFESADVYWPGVQIKYRNTYFPSYAFGYYNEHTDLNTKVDVIIKWLEKPHTTLGLLYHPHPDHEGHIYGPSSKEIFKVIKELDDSLGYLISQRNQSSLNESLNIIIVSDHGMTDISMSKVVYVDEYISPDLYFIGREESYCLWGIWPKNKTNYNKILKLSTNLNNSKLLEKKNYPKRWRWSNNRSIPPMIILADFGYCLLHNKNNTINLNGTHGYDNNEDSMNGIFIASGPDIIVSNDSNIVLRVIDVHPLISKILNLKNVPQVDGSLEKIEWMIRDKRYNRAIMISLIAITSIIVLSCLTACLMCICAQMNVRSSQMRLMNPSNIKGHILSLGTRIFRTQPQSSTTNRKTKIKNNKINKKKFNLPNDAEAGSFLLENTSDDDDDDSDESSDDILAEVVTKPQSLIDKSKSVTTSAR